MLDLEDIKKYFPNLTEDQVSYIKEAKLTKQDVEYLEMVKEFHQYPDWVWI